MFFVGHQRAFWKACSATFRKLLGDVGEFYITQVCPADGGGNAMFLISSAAEFDAVINQKYGVSFNYVRGIDGTAIGIACPDDQELQLVVQNDHKLKHVLKFQSIRLPCAVLNCLV